VDELEKAVASGGPAANAAKRRVAREVVALYHGVDAAASAEQRFDRFIKRGELRVDAATFPIPDGDPVHLPGLLASAGLAPSSSAGRRLIDEGAVRIDGDLVPARRYDLERAAVSGRVLAVGKRNAVRLVES
jgi:tyrosyl-tRNA synthetase